MDEAFSHAVNQERIARVLVAIRAFDSVNDVIDHKSDQIEHFPEHYASSLLPELIIFLDCVESLNTDEKIRRMLESIALHNLYIREDFFLLCKILSPDRRQNIQLIWQTLNSVD